MEVFGDETPRQNSGVQRNAMMNRVGSDKRILLFSEVIPDSADFISCLEPGQEEIDPAPGWPWQGLESDWSDTPDRDTPARLGLSLWCLRATRRGNDLESSPSDWNRLLLSDLRSFSAGRDQVFNGSEGLAETESISGQFINEIPMGQLTPEQFIGGDFDNQAVYTMDKRIVRVFPSIFLGHLFLAILASSRHTECLLSSGSGRASKVGSSGFVLGPTGLF